MARNPRRRRALRECYRRLDDQLDGHRYLAGDELTIADFPAGITLDRYIELEIERPALPNVEAWYHRLAKRRAYREHVMIPFEDLRGRLEY